MTRVRVDARPQPGDRTATITCSQQIESIVQALQQLRGGECGQTLRRQLDGERQPVKPLTDPADYCRVDRLVIVTKLGSVTQEPIRLGFVKRFYDDDGLA